MAYMLGFWFADGCIYKGRLFDITVHKKDKYIIKQFAKELNYKGSILDYVDRQAVRLNFSCAVIYNDIVALGGTERKDLTIQFPNVPDKYLNDFIRGYFDGNGSAVLIKNCRLNTSFYCRNKDFLMSLWKILKDKAGVLGGSYNQNNSSLTFGKRDSILIGQFMYKNNPELFLERKHKKFNPIGGK